MPAGAKKKAGESSSSSRTFKTKEASAAAASSTPASSLEAELARGLRLTEELTSSTTTTGSSTATTASHSPSTIQPSKQGITVLFEVDLQYAPAPDDDATNPTTKRKCHLPACSVTEGSSSTPLATCAQCQTVRYCGRAHQTQDWKQGHKYECAQWKTLAAMATATAAAARAESRDEEEDEERPDAESGKDEKKVNPNFASTASASAASEATASHPQDSAPAASTTTTTTPTAATAAAAAVNPPLPSEFDKQDIASKLLCKVRLHLGPYTIAHYDKQGRGFAFVQSTATANDLFIPRPITSKGRPLERSVLLHFLTWGEFVSVVLEDDFEYTVAREPLEEVLAAYDPEMEYVVLLKLRCGFLAVMRVPLVPNAGACRRLAQNYQWADRTSVKLELD